ncbi:MAG: hypothetical protein ACJ76V_02110 [Thermoleophilaceae bacterium]
MRITKTLALAALLALALSAPAFGATNASGSQAVTGAPDPTLTASFPSDYSWGSWAIGSGNVSGEQITNVKSNEQWGLKVSSDQAGGLMRRWNGSSYVTGQLANPLQWANTSIGASVVGSPAFGDLSSTPALVAGSQAITADSGTDVGVKFKQLVSYADDASLGTDVYRILVSYDAAQGF